jgi:signal transduction histidine kinase
MTSPNMSGGTASTPAASMPLSDARPLDGAADALPHDEALRFLLEAGDALSSSLDYETTLTTVVHQAVPRLADWCALDLLDETGRLHRLAVAHPDPNKVALAYELQRRYPEDPQSPYGAYARIRERTTLHVADIPDALLVESASDAEHLRLLRELGLRSFITVPLIARDEAMGVLTLVAAESGRRYGPGDVRIVEELARRAALAIDHARTHRSALETAMQLEQQALELELQTQQLQDQALEMEAQQSELEMQTEELQSANDELRMANDATMRAEAFSRSIVTSIADALVVYDADWRCRFANPRAIESFTAAGYSGAFVGRILWEEFPDLVGTPFQQELQRAAAARTPVVFTEYRAASATWAEVRCSPVDNGGLVVLWRDVTEQRRADEALHFLSRASEILVSSLDYESTIGQLAHVVVPRLADWCGVDLIDEAGQLRQLAVAHVDPDKTVWARELNRRYPPDPAAPTGVPNVIRTGRPELYPEISDELLAASAVDAEHLRILRQLGFTAAIVVPLQARGRVLGAMTLVSAESGRRYTDADLRLAQELGNRAAIAVDNALLYQQAVTARDVAERSRAVAEDANAAKSAFLAQMSHELRTPLNAIDGYASLLELGVRGPLTGEQLKDIARIRRSQRHLLSLINDVLNYAKIEAGRVQFNLGPVALTPALEGLQPLVEPLLREREQRFTLQPLDSEVTITADADKLQQILLNLLSNAIKFTPRGGEIGVAASVENGHALISVTDTGMGIPTEKAEEIFEPFVQLRSDGSTPREGTGLGLAISRDLARGMGGDLTVTSIVGGGSTFVVRLPRVSAAALPDL